MINKKILEEIHSKWKNTSRWVTIEEANLLYDIVDKVKPKYIFESGTANGYSSVWLSLSGIPVITFDPYNREKIWELFEGCPKNITYVQDRFSSIVDRFSDLFGMKLFFLDGDHNSSGIKEDCDVIIKYASCGDIVIFHDLNMSSVFRFWHRMCANASSYRTYDTKRMVGELTWRGVK